MIPGLPFGAFRWTILALAVLAQFYLFFRARRAIRSSRHSGPFKSRAIKAIGVFLVVFLNRSLPHREVPPWGRGASQE